MTTAETERAKIVAWLRGFTARTSLARDISAANGGDEMCTLMDEQTHVLKYATAAIERGDHEGIDI